VGGVDKVGPRGAKDKMGEKEDNKGRGEGDLVAESAELRGITKGNQIFSELGEISIAEGSKGKIFCGKGKKTKRGSLTFKPPGISKDFYFF